MDLKIIRRLLRLMKAGDVTELELEDAPSGIKVRLARQAHGLAAPYVVAPAAAPPLMPLAVPGAETAAPAGRAGGGEGSALPPNVKQVTSPMVGTFYRSPTPEAESFVGVGSLVSEGTVLCIVEAMKVMNEIKAEISGEIVRVLAENGEPVEYGQPLFLVKTG